MLDQIIPILEQMSHDELRDFIDYCEFVYLSQQVPTKDKQRDIFMKRVKHRRSGLPTGGFPDELIKAVRGTKTLSMTTPLQVSARDIVSTASKADLVTVFGSASPIHDTRSAIAWVLLRSKAPIRRNSEGNIQVKKIPYKRVRKEYNNDGLLVPVLDANGEPIVEEFKETYLYLRYWTVQGDSDRSMRRYQNIYIGGSDEDGYTYRALADYFQAMIREYGVSRTRQVTDKQTGEITTQEYKTRPKNDDNPIAELESKIMACIDMSKDTPVIDHDCLMDVQAELSPSD